MLATPITAAVATNATPMSSPIIIHRVRRTPMLIPRVMASVMHMPGVIETKKKVGINTASKAKSGMAWSVLDNDEKADSVMKIAAIANLWRLCLGK